MSIDRKKLLFGMASFIPGFKGRVALTTGGTNSAEYCYSVWLRHLTLAFQNRLCSQPPEVVAELGPGDSIGIGLAALLSGCRQYIGLDVVDHTRLEKNLAVLDGLVGLFKRRAPIPHGPGFENVKPQLSSYAFPSEIFSETHLNAALADHRIDLIRASINNVNGKDSCIRYALKWHLSEFCQRESIDMIYSQAVMEYIDEYPDAYRRMRMWLKPHGFMSHQIDFKSHGTTSNWDGHWECSDLLWKLMRGKRPYFISRSTHAQHIKAITQAGFSVVADQRTILSATVPRERLNPRFRSFDEDDLTVAGAFIQAKCV